MRFAALPQQDWSPYPSMEVFAMTPKKGGARGVLGIRWAVPPHHLIEELAEEAAPIP